MSAREHGIIFSRWSVVAIGKGLKTQTRRLDRGQKPYQTGDRLWVRESFWIGHDSDCREMEASFDCGVDLKEDKTAPLQFCSTPNNPELPDEPGNWFGPDDIFPERIWVKWSGAGMGPEFWSKRPAMYMPRWASRHTLEVTAVRRQRVQDISEEDAIAEGVSSGVIPATGDHPQLIGFVYGRDDGACVLHPSARDAYALAWDALNARRRRREYLQIGDPDYRGRPWRTVIDETACWAANPTVYAYTFKVVPR